MDLDLDELLATRKLNRLYKKDDININWERMYLDEVDKHVDVVLLYNKLLKENGLLREKIKELEEDIQNGIKLVSILTKEQMASIEYKVEEDK